jgi:hypothetical protein
MARKLLLHCKIVKLPVKPAPSGILSCGLKRRRRPVLGVGNSFPIWKEGGGGGVCRGSKKTFRPYVLISNPEFPLGSGLEGRTGICTHLLTARMTSCPNASEW